MEKIEKVKGDGRVGLDGVAVLKREVHTGFIEKVTIEQRLEKVQGDTYGDIKGGAFQAQQTASRKGRSGPGE